MKTLIQHYKLIIVVFLMIVFTTSNNIAQATKGYNQKIPESIMTPDKVETRLGTLEFYDGMPTDETAQKVFDNLDFMRGVEVFLNFIPATSGEG